MRYIVFDTETTGVNPEKQAVEFAMLEIDEHMKPCAECSALVKPTCPISPEAEAIHGISLESLKDCPTITEWVEANLGGPLEGEVTLIGHRIGFDKPLFAPFGNCVRTLDTLALAFEFISEAPDKKLDTLKQYLDLPGGGESHRAMADVITCHQLLVHLSDVMGRNLEQMVTEPYDVHFCPWGKHAGKPLREVPRAYRNWMLGLVDLDPNLRRGLERVALMDPPFKPVVMGARARPSIPKRSFR
jgi:DNA polymerase-3 subunit epsilon